MKIENCKLKISRKGAIGVFDSGFGGLDVLKHIVKKLPQYDYIYLGDTARAPYGERSQEVIFSFTKQAVEFLFAQGCPLVILACNTASSEALRKIQKEYLAIKFPDNRVLGVLIPMAQEATEKNRSKIGVIGTSGTVASFGFIKEIKKINPKAKVFQKACPLLVPIVEAGEEKSQIANLALTSYLKYFKNKKIQALILGCTHYGLLKAKIKKIIGKDVVVISSGYVTAKKLKSYLNNHPEMEKRISKTKTILFYSTDITDKFQKLGTRFFNKPIKPKKVSLE